MTFDFTAARQVMVDTQVRVADVTDLPEADVQPGVFARFFGPDAPLDDFAARAGTIGYHVLTSLGARYARIVKG